ncbi:MAG: patatin-like phospholipase family protein [Acidobacteriota bacterium]
MSRSIAGGVAAVHRAPFQFDEGRRTNMADAPPVGLALAGGAPGGAIYEIGALRALDEAIVGLDLRDCQAYVGVSAGAFLTSCLANGLSTAQQVRAIVKPEPGEHPFVPETFFQPAVAELGRRMLRVPSLLGGALRDFALRRERRLIDALTVLGEAVPTGIFANEPIRDYVRRIFSIKGRTDRFRDLPRKLTVVATDLESGESTRFGHLGRSYVPISTAVQASTALPGLYPPVEIDGRFYVDGVLLKTMHASVALEAGAQLVFCINPLVPVDTRAGIQRNEIRPGQIPKSGLPSVLSQTVRTLIHSRMVLGIEAYNTKYPDADVVLLEPPRDDYEEFFSNIFSFSARRGVCERAYEATRASLRLRREELSEVLGRWGLALDEEFLDDPKRDLWAGVGLHEMAPEDATPPAADAELLDRLADALDRVERLAGV